MSDQPQLAILVPTRARPHTVHALALAFARTCTADTWLIFCVDGDENPAYAEAHRLATMGVYPRILMRHGPRRRLVGTLNHYAPELASAPDAPTAIGYMGDDHRPETAGWDAAFLTALAELGTGIVYGDDGHQGARLPTAMAMTPDIPRVLGFIAAPVLNHMYCDNYWKDLGEAAGCLTYLPDVRITHHHPGIGKGTWDASYAESNSSASYAADEAAYRRYRDDGHLVLDADLIRATRTLARQGG